MTVYWLEQAASDVPGNNDWLCSIEQECLDSMRFPKRRADWRLGRWTAKQAVAACLALSCHPQTLAGLEIRPNPSGAPEVFRHNRRTEVSISLSHRGEMAVCAVAPSDAMLGCDLELIEPRSEGFTADYFSPEEQRMLTRAPASDRDKLVTLIWSAKESALKALGVGLRLDTRGVNVTLSEDALLSKAQDRSASFEIFASSTQNPTIHWQPLQVASEDGLIFHGWWRQSGQFLHTMVASPPPPPPVALTSLARAAS